MSILDVYDFMSQQLFVLRNQTTKFKCITKHNSHTQQHKNSYSHFKVQNFTTATPYLVKKDIYTATLNEHEIETA